MPRSTYNDKGEEVTEMVWEEDPDEPPPESAGSGQHSAALKERSGNSTTRSRHHLQLFRSHSGSYDPSRSCLRCMQLCGRIVMTGRTPASRDMLFGECCIMLICWLQ